MNSLLQSAGCAFGLTGSLLVAANRRYSRWGFIAYLCSNTAWLCYALKTGTWGLFIEQLGYMTITVFGLRRWFFAAQGKSPH